MLAEGLLPSGAGSVLTQQRAAWHSPSLEGKQARQTGLVRDGSRCALWGQGAACWDVDSERPVQPEYIE